MPHQIIDVVTPYVAVPGAASPEVLAAVRETSEDALAQVPGMAASAGSAAGATAGAAAATQAVASNPEVVTAAAALAQSDAGLVRTSDDRIVQPAAQSEDVAFAVTDSMGRASWLSTTAEGLPSRHSIKNLSESGVGVFSESGAAGDRGYAFVVVDDHDHLTDLRLGSDGKIAPDVIEDWSSRMLRVPRGLTCVGDSITQGGQGNTDVRWAQLVADSMGLPLWNPSQSGEAPLDIAFRSGAFTPQVTLDGGLIPTSATPVIVTSITGMGTDGWRHDTGESWNGKIGHFTNVRLMGVSGVLHHDQIDGSWSFTPSGSRGTPVPVPDGSTICTQDGTSHRGDLWIMWPGRNATQLDAITTSVELMRNFLELPDRFLVLSVLNADSETVGTPSYDKIINLNASLAAAYPQQYVDVRTHLVSQGLADNGLNPTDQDNTDIGNGLVPSSLRADQVHPNMYGAISIAKCLNEALTEKGWTTR